MKHLGDVTKIRGYDAPVVDVVIGGSPCQDLSVAGGRAGLSGERSGLYMEQIRIIREMREKDAECGRTGEFIRPRYMVWENVPGAFSCTKGRDFAAALEEAVKVVEPEAPPISVPDKGWPTSGCLHGMDGGWSIAWRVLDAQFWGVPQRRRRIALVADFGGMSAPEILFVRQGVSGDSEQGKSHRKEVAGDIGNGTGKPVAFGISPYESNAMKPSNPHSGIYVADTSRITGFTGIVLNDQGGERMSVSADGISPTIRAEMHGHEPAILDVGLFSSAVDGPAVCYDSVTFSDTASTLRAGAGAPKHLSDIVGRLVMNRCDNKEYRILDISHRYDAIRDCGDISYSLQARMGTGGNNIPLVTDLDLSGCSDETPHYEQGVIRRLTPMECERLQGYPDGWSDIGEWVDSKGKKHKPADTPRYKALGNSIALPPWKWVLERLCSQYDRKATMASLFDGIAGFPLLWEQINGKGSCVWASEIEEFPMAVSKRRLGDD